MDPDTIKKITDTLLKKANALVMGGFLNEAIATYDLIITSKFNGVEDALASKAYLLFSRLNRLEEALALYRSAIALNPCHLASINGLAVIYRYLSDYKKAETLLDISLAIDPGNNVAALNKGTILLSANAEGGWRYYLDAISSTRKVPQALRHIPPLESISGVFRSRLVVYNEERIENAIIMFPYVCLMHARFGCNVRFIINHQLLFLFHNLPSDIYVISFNSVESSFYHDSPEFRCGVLDLPMMFPEEPYLDSVYRRSVYDSYFVTQRYHRPFVKTIGVHWDPSASRYSSKIDAITIEDLYPLFLLDRNIRILTSNGSIAELNEIINRYSVEIIQYSCISDMELQLRECDMIVSGDDLVSNLAGLLRVPGIVLLPTVSHYSWLVGTLAPSYYPSLRVIRKAPKQNWRDVIVDACAMVLCEESPSS